MSEILQPDHEITVLSQLFKAGLKTKEIADRIGKEDAAVRMQISRLRKVYPDLFPMRNKYPETDGAADPAEIARLKKEVRDLVQYKAFYEAAERVLEQKSFDEVIDEWMD